MIYLDNAATTTPKPSAVIRSVNEALRRFSANPGRSGHTPSVMAAGELYRARKAAAALFTLDKEENVIFTQNCTAALNTVMKGILKQGDHAVISSLEHNAVLRPLENLRQKGVVTYTVAEVGENDDQTLESFRKAINSHTRLIICTHASNVSGAILPVRRLCALAHSYGVLFCLDAAQSAGVLPIDLQDDGYDFVCCAGHKGLYGPMGTGLLLVNSSEIPATLVEGGTGSESADALMPAYLPDHLESGTQNVPGIIGLSAGIDFVRSRGIENIYRQELAHIRYLYDGLSKLGGVRIHSPLAQGRESVPVLSFTVEGTDSETVASFLNDRYGIAVRAGLHCAPLAHRSMGTLSGGTVRVSPSVFTHRQDMQVFLFAMNKFVHSS